MVGFLLYCRECQSKHGLLPRFWDHAQIQAPGQKADLLPSSPKPGSSWAVVLEVSWSPTWKGDISLQMIPDTGRSAGSCRLSSSSPRTLQPGKAGLQRLEKRLLVWLWSGLDAELAPSATSPSATSSIGCSNPKTLRQDDKEPTCVLAWCCPFSIRGNSKNVCFCGINGKKGCPPHCLKFLSQHFL